MSWSRDSSPAALPSNMAAVTSVFHRVRTGSKIGAQYDQEGNLIQVNQSPGTFGHRFEELDLKETARAQAAATLTS